MSKADANRRNPSAAPGVRASSNSRERQIDPVIGGVPRSTARLLMQSPTRRLFEYFSWLRIKADWNTGMLPAHATPRWIEEKFRIGKEQRKALDRELVRLGLAKTEQPMEIRMVRGRNGISRRRKVKTERKLTIFAKPQIAKQACISTAALLQSGSKTGPPNSLRIPTAIALGAAPLGRPSQDTRSAPMKTVENSEQQLTSEIEKLGKSKSFPTNPYPADPLRADLYEAIYRKDVDKAFRDTDRPSFRFVEQLRECVKSASGTLKSNRVATLKHLDEDDIVNAALERLIPHRDALFSIRNSDVRRHQVVRSVVGAVIEAAAAMLEPQKKKPPARAGDHEARAEPKNGAAA